MTDKEMMENPSKWPKWPVLPVKKHAVGVPEPEVGLMAAGRPTQVYRIGLYDLQGGVLADVLADVPYDEYTSVDDVVAAGWIVD